MNSQFKNLIEQAQDQYLVSHFQKAESIYNKALESKDAQDTDLAQVFQDLGVLYAALARYDKAEAHFITAQTILEKRLGNDHPLVAIVLRHLAALDRDNSNSESIKIADRALTIWHDYLYCPQLPPTDPNDFDALYGLESATKKLDLFYTNAKLKEKEKEQQKLFVKNITSTALYELALLEKTRGNFQINKQYLLKALAEENKDSLSTAIILQQLGQTNLILGFKDDAIASYRDALAIFEEQQKLEHPKIHELYFGLGKALIANKSYSEAEEVLCKAQYVLAKNISDRHPYTAFILLEFANLNQIKKQYSEAESRYREALDILLNFYGKKHPTIAQIYIFLGQLMLEQENYIEAENLWSAAINQVDSPLEIARIQDNLANLYLKQNKYSQSESAYRRGLQIRKQVIDGCKQSIADTYLNMAQFYLAWHKLIDAENYFNSALEAGKTYDQNKEAYIIKCQIGLAQVYFKQGNFKQAEFLLDKIIASIEETDENKISNEAYCLTLLGQIYTQQNKFKKAQDNYNKAIALIAASFGQNDITLVPVLISKAELELSTNNSDSNIRTLLQAADILDKSDDTDFSLLAMVNCDLASAYKAIEENHLSEKCLQNCLSIAEQKLNPIESVSIYNKVADYYQQTASSTEAFNYRKQALRLAEITFGTNHFLTAHTLSKLALFYAETNQLQKAIELYMRALPVLESTMGSMQPDLASNLINLANAYIKQNNCEEAKKLLKRACSILEKSLGREHPQTVNTKQSLDHLSV